MRNFSTVAAISVLGLAAATATPLWAQSSTDVPGTPDGPFALVTNSENLPGAAEAAGFPTSWPMIYQTANRDGGVPGGMSSAGNRWIYAEARAWPLDRPSFDAEAITIKSAETTAAQWQGNAVGVSSAKGMIFAGSGDQFVYALNAKTGKLVWRASPVGSTFMGQPIVHDNLVYVNAGTVGFNYSNVQKFQKTGTAVRGAGVAYNGIYALDINSGKLVWHHDTVGDAMPTPAYANGHLVMSDGSGEVTSLDAATGAVVWKAKVGGMGNMSSPAIADGRVFAGMASPAFLYAFDEKSGNVLWKTSIPHAVNTGMGDVSPSIADGVLVTDAVVQLQDSKAAQVNQAGGTGKMRMTIAGFDVTNGKMLWSYTTNPGPKPPSFKGGVPMIHDGVVYVGEPVDNAYQAFDLKTGKLKWTWNIPDPSEAGSGRGPAAWYNGYLYVATGPSLYKIDPKTGKMLGEKKIGGRFGITGPTIVNGTIYVGNSSDWVIAVPVSDLDKSAG